MNLLKIRNTVFFLVIFLMTGCTSLPFVRVIQVGPGAYNIVQVPAQASSVVAGATAAGLIGAILLMDDPMTLEKLKEKQRKLCASGKALTFHQEVDCLTL
jgi:hypothetical protein